MVSESLMINTTLTTLNLWGDYNMNEYNNNKEERNE